MKKRESLNLYIQDSICSNWDLLALSDFNGISLQYRDVARKIAKLHIFYDAIGIQKGDRIALCGRNSTHWSIAFLSAITYGAVAVPILHEFKPENIHNLVSHSDAKLLFCDEEIWGHLSANEMPAIEGAIMISNYDVPFSRNPKVVEAREHLNELFGKKYPERFTKEDVKYWVDEPDKLAVINYTSGSTGFSKGVMLSYRSLLSNLQYCIEHLTFLKPGDGIVCMLPLAHMYGLMVDLIHCLSKGCHIYFLTRLPSPTVILKAFDTVKPKMIVTVPLIIEKIIRTKIFPLLQKPYMRFILMLPFVKDIVLKKVRNKLITAFGGAVQQLIIGGAGVSKDVERFLRKIKFPFTVGYGMTECAPLIAYAPWDVQRPGSCGVLVDRMECKVDSPDPEKVPGVLWVKGDNVMQGYFKNDDATNAVMKDGWMNTGDICTIDKDGYIYIKGRDKNMILGPSGQNIYPEEIEQLLMNKPYVLECLIVSTGENKLQALIYPDKELAKQNHLSDKDIENIMTQNVKEVNEELPTYSKISITTIVDKEFEKTPKRSIKRYLYQK